MGREPVDDGSLRSELDGLSTEGSDSDLADLDLLTTAQQVARANALDAQVAAAVAAAAAQVVRVVDATVDRLDRGGRLRYLGAGTGGRIASMDAEEIAPSFGVDGDLVAAVVAAVGGLSGVQDREDDEVAGRADVAALGLTADDVVVAVSASGRTPYVLAGVREARAAGSLTVGVVCAAGSALAESCDLSVEVVVGPELVAGSTRLRAGTAQKLVLNQISTLTMVRLGHTYGNLMIGVRADNAKLVRRRTRVVQEVTGADEQVVAAALLAAGGDAKTAVVMILGGLDAAQAGQRLLASRGYVRAALAAGPGGPVRR